VKIVCLGNLTIDDVVMPDGQTFMAHCGGDALYSGFGAHLWLDDIGIVTPVGLDFPQEYLDRIEAAGWDMDGFRRRHVPGIRSWVLHEDDGRRHFVLRSRADDFLVLSPRVDDIPAAWLDASGFHIAAMELAAQEELAEHLEPLPAVVSLDPRVEYIAGNKDRLQKLISKVNIFTPSHLEVETFFGHQDDRRAARDFADFGCDVVIIKQGEQGSLIYERVSNRFWQLPAVPTEVIDVTGAGDAYCGGFLANYVQTGDLPRSGLAGAVSASFAIEQFGSLHMLYGDRSRAAQRLTSLVDQLKLFDGDRNEN
jgi:ribokinase